MNSASKIGLESNSHAFLVASGTREASASVLNPSWMQPDVLGTASLHDNALGEGSSLDVEFDDIMDVDFTLSISHLNDMLFGRRSRSSRVSVFDLDLVSLRSEMCSHGIDYSRLSGDSHAYRSALLSHVLLGDCFQSRC